MPTVLESLLDPIDPIEFREQYYGKQPLLIRGNPEKFANLFGWADLNQLLNTAPYPHPHVYISHPRKREVASSPDSIIERCRAGTALIVSKLDVYDPKVGELARGLEAETGEPMTVTMILSQPAQTVFVTHWDANDVFVLHIDGRKGWSVWDRTIEKPVVDMEEVLYPRPPHPTIECEMTPGDVLYIPRGHWHQALSQTGSSLHLSIVVVARTGIDFVTWLRDELRNDVRFREELPLTFASEPAEVREARLREYVTRLGDALVSRFRDEETLQSFMRHCVVADRDVRRVKFPAQLFEAPGAQLRVRRFSRPARQRFVLNDGPADDQITLGVWGQTLHFPKSARPLLEFVLSRTEFALEDAQAHAGGLTEEGIREVLDLLLRDGILDAADGERVAAP
jgi:ribosomal protein L16 Arg81 hydroxylase